MKQKKRRRSPWRHRALMAGLAGALAAIAGCSSTVSRGIDDEGRVAEPVFPAIADDTTRPEGSFPNLDNLRAVGPGMTKNQLQALLGPPHFGEGLFGVREWDYLLHFRSGGGITSCQYKVIFDRDMLARSFLWHPGACAVMAAPPHASPAAVRAAIVPAPRGAPPPPQPLQLSADALFAFDGIDLLPEGRRQIAQLAARLEGAQVERIRVVGHSDRLGDAAYNQRLSERRAQAVRAALVAQGMPAARVLASGRGATQPVVQCAPRGRAALRACLAPNRRVDITVQAFGQPDR